jgi:hypothetical protein
MKKAASGPVGLHPLAVNNKLWDRPFADVPKYLIRRAWSLLDIDLGIGDIVCFQEAFRFAAVAAPGGGVKE